MKHTPEAMREMADTLLTRVFQGHLIVDKELDRAAAMLRDIADEREAANHPKILEGWKLVPAEPTDRMVEHARTACVAANFYVQGEKPRDPIVQERILLTAAYKAMLSVAPSPEGGEL